MSILDRILKIKNVDIIENQTDYDDWDIKSIGKLLVPETFTDLNSFLLCNTVSELNFPVDFTADRVSRLRFYIADKDGNEIENTELNRFVSDSINPFYSFSDLVYQYVFSLFGSGNTFNYLSVPSTYKKISPSSIARWDVLIPNDVFIEEQVTQSLLDISDIKELIKKAEYRVLEKRKKLELDKLFIDNYSFVRKPGSQILSRPALMPANKSIDTLLSVYSARYNIYANNGAAGYLAKKSTSSNNSLESLAIDSSNREDILKDINKRNGLTGKRNIWGISGVPIEFVKTIATIKELQPFDEALDDAIKIAGTLQIPSGLVPRKDQSTYNNQAADEHKWWENAGLSIAKTVSENLTKLFKLDSVKNKIWFDSSEVSALVANESSNQDLIAKKIANLKSIKEMNPDIDINEEMIKIFEQYGKK